MNQKEAFKRSLKSFTLTPKHSEFPKAIDSKGELKKITCVHTELIQHRCLVLLENERGTCNHTPNLSPTLLEPQRWDRGGRAVRGVKNKILTIRL